MFRSEALHQKNEASGIELRHAPKVLRCNRHCHPLSWGLQNRPFFFFLGGGLDLADGNLGLVLFRRKCDAIFAMTSCYARPAKEVEC